MHWEKQYMLAGEKKSFFRNKAWNKQKKDARNSTKLTGLSLIQEIIIILYEF